MRQGLQHSILSSTFGLKALFSSWPSFASPTQPLFCKPFHRQIAAPLPFRERSIVTRLLSTRVPPRVGTSFPSFPTRHRAPFEAGSPFLRLEESRLQTRLFTRTIIPCSSKHNHCPVIHYIIIIIHFISMFHIVINMLFEVDRLVWSFLNTILFIHVGASVYIISNEGKTLDNYDWPDAVMAPRLRKSNSLIEIPDHA